MSVWHASHPDVREIFPLRREDINEKNTTMQATLQVPAASIATFIQDILRDRPCIETTGGIYVCPQRIESVHSAGTYTTDAGQNIIIPANYYHVTINYASDPRIWATIFGQEVLVNEFISVTTEHLNQDFTLFAWESDPTKCLTSPDMCPGKIFRSFKITLVIDRLDINVASTGTGEQGMTPLDVLQLISSTCNDASVTFWTLPITCEAETVMAEVESVERTIEPWNGAGYDDWWTLRIGFSIRPDSWNKIWRYKKAGSQDDSGWEHIVHVKTSGDPSTPTIETIHSPEPYIGYFLN